MPATQDSDSASIRPRMRRPASTPGRNNADTTKPASRSSTSLQPSPNLSPSRGASPIPSARIGSSTGRNNGSAIGQGNGGGRTASSAFGGGFLDSSWAPSWASVQGFAASLLTGGGDGAFESGSDQAGSKSGSRTRKPMRRTVDGNSSHKKASAWGPEPPGSSRPRLADVAAGAQAQRQAALKALKTASVLESYEGVNGGLDASGKFKKRRSDEDLRDASRPDETEEHLVYIHHVQKTDTYAGIVLKYRCREDAFRKANGLWSRDNIQVRKWLAMPVDACEVRGRPCQGPSNPGEPVDLLAPTPDAIDPYGGHGQQDDFFAASANKTSDQPKAEQEGTPWTHVRWVTVDSFTTPVEIARVPRKALGYFPPRRKKTLHSSSSLSTPRGSLDVPSIILGSEAIDSPGSTSSRRHSLLSGGQQLAGQQFANAYGGSTPASLSRSRVNSGGDDVRPAWMRRPGGVGSLGKNVRAPGPDKDYFNTWTKKHIPGLNIESFPSMSVMGSEIARFAINGAEQAGIVDSPFEEGRDLSSPSRQGSGLDKAAAAVETWLRGALAKRPGTPNLGPRGRPTQREGDLIELTDTNSDDGKGGPLNGAAEFPDLGLPSSSAYGSSSRRAGEGSVRGRSTGNSIGQAKKAD